METVIFAVPTFLAKMTPAAVTEITPVFEDLNEYFFVPLAPPAFIRYFLRAAILTGAFRVSFWGALVIVKYLVMVPLYFPRPVILTVAFPGRMLLL